MPRYGPESFLVSFISEIGLLREYATEWLHVPLPPPLPRLCTESRCFDGFTVQLTPQSRLRIELSRRVLSAKDIRASLLCEKDRLSRLVLFCAWGGKLYAKCRRLFDVCFHGLGRNRCGGGIDGVGPGLALVCREGESVRSNRRSFDSASLRSKMTIWFEGLLSLQALLKATADLSTPLHFVPGRSR